MVGLRFVQNNDLLAEVKSVVSGGDEGRQINSRSGRG